MKELAKVMACIKTRSKEIAGGMAPIDDQIMEYCKEIYS